jgi:tungstate transport system ATP-binding protein
VVYELKNITKTFEQRTVLNLERLSVKKGKILGLLGPNRLSVKKGKILGLLGPNGAGKTTLLEIMAFLSSPTSGEMWFNQQEVDFTGGKLRDLRRRVVLVQQDSILFSTSVSNNVDFPLRIRKARTKGKARADRGRIARHGGNARLRPCTST